MEKQVDKSSEGKVNAGRGIAPEQNKRIDSDDNMDESLENERPDDRARKAGY